MILHAQDGIEGKGFDYGVKPKLQPIIHARPYVLAKVLSCATLQPAFAGNRKLTKPLLTRDNDLMRAPACVGR